VPLAKQVHLHTIFGLAKVILEPRLTSLQTLKAKREIKAIKAIKAIKVTKVPLVLA
jgi:hypothetical protein